MPEVPADRGRQRERAEKSFHPSPYDELLTLEGTTLQYPTDNLGLWA